ncbi:26S proteasome non-ATPase regulatory subunit 2 1A [Acorus calamus]|uniref:26S proteasome non-ATPase regulatory subunit 2 1A n=1 Tax=Acorus calamus TaxID=4465 RepID=A0AAV9D1D1_ACOCL|nr:26S proteasome non-ATPase regulatory subunit 2 1A [Acorus calamus]
MPLPDRCRVWKDLVFPFVIHKEEISPSTSPMISIPKPLKYLKPHYPFLCPFFEKLTKDSDIQVVSINSSQAEVIEFGFGGTCGVDRGLSPKYTNTFLIFLRTKKWQFSKLDGSSIGRRMATKPSSYYPRGAGARSGKSASSPRTSGPGSF